MIRIVLQKKKKKEMKKEKEAKPVARGKAKKAEAKTEEKWKWCEVSLTMCLCVRVGAQMCVTAPCACVRSCVCGVSTCTLCVVFLRVCLHGRESVWKLVWQGGGLTHRRLLPNTQPAANDQNACFHVLAVFAKPAYPVFR